MVLALPPLTWPIPVTIAHPDSSAQAGHSFVSSQARWVEREEVREQQVDARNSLWAPCPALTQPSPTMGPLTVAVRLGASGTAVASPIPGSSLTRPLPSKNTLN